MFIPIIHLHSIFLFIIIKYFIVFFMIKIVKSPIIMLDFLECIIFFPLINPLNSFYEY